REKQGQTRKRWPSSLEHLSKPSTETLKRYQGALESNTPGPSSREADDTPAVPPRAARRGPRRARPSRPLTHPDSWKSLMKTFLDRIDAYLNAIDATLMFFAVLCLCAIGLLTTADVAMRYAFNSPFVFAFDLTSMYLFPASV